MVDAYELRREEKDCGSHKRACQRPHSTIPFNSGTISNHLDLHFDPAHHFNSHSILPAINHTLHSSPFHFAYCQKRDLRQSGKNRGYLITMITLTPLSSSASSSSTSEPVCYLLELDEARILLDLGQRDYRASSQQSSWEYEEKVRE